LVHPLGYGSENAGRDVSRMANIMPPLGLASIAAFLERDNIGADIIDCYALPLSDPFIRDYLTRLRPAFIGFSCTTSSFLDGVRIADLAKSIEPCIKTVFGGPHVSALKTRILEDFPEVDFCVVGEGEETLEELLQSGGQRTDLRGIEGIAYRDEEGNPFFTGYRKKAVHLTCNSRRTRVSAISR